MKQKLFRLLLYISSLITQHESKLTQSAHSCSCSRTNQCNIDVHELTHTASLIRGYTTDTNSEPELCLIHMHTFLNVIPGGS